MIAYEYKSRYIFTRWYHQIDQRSRQIVAQRSKGLDQITTVIGHRQFRVVQVAQVVAEIIRSHHYRYKLHIYKQ